MSIQLQISLIDELDLNEIDRKYGIHTIKKTEAFFIKQYLMPQIKDSDFSHSDFVESFKNYKETLKLAINTVTYVQPQQYTKTVHYADGYYDVNSLLL